jgi:hypothetical protein
MMRNKRYFFYRENPNESSQKHSNYFTLDQIFLDLIKTIDVVNRFVNISNFNFSFPSR